VPRPPSNLIEAARRRAGARYFRVALQVNPWAYVERRGRDPKPASSEGEYNEVLVAALRATGVEAIAVTDHDSVRSSASLMEAAHEAGIVAFPGFEVASKEGVHVLAVFPADRPLEAVDRALFKIKGPSRPP